MIEVLLIREGDTLKAADALSSSALAKIKKGELLTAKIHRPRNPKHHRKLWALLQAVYDNQEFYATTDDLLTGLKIETGLFDKLKTTRGIPVIIPKSISFTAMDQARFEEWYEKAVDVILTRILPGVNREELTAHVNEILEGNNGGSYAR